MTHRHDEIWESVPEHRHSNARVDSWAIEAVRAHEQPRLLDLGCGDGRLGIGLATAGARVVGADVSSVALERGRNAHPELEFVQVDEAAPLPFEDASFDAAVCIHVLEHVADTQQLMSELRRVLAPRARLAVSVPDHSWLRTVLAGPRAYERSHDPLQPTLHFYTRRTLREMLDSFGFDAIELERTGGALMARARRG